MPEIKIRINGEMQKFSYSQRKDSRLYFRRKIGIKGYNDNGTPLYDYDNIYGKNELELKRKIIALYDEDAKRENESKFFVTDIQRWLRITLFKHVKGTTYDRYEQVIKYQIVPQAEKLEHKLVTQIKMDDIKTILNGITDSGKSESTLKKARHLLRSYFHDKLIAGEIERDPTDFKARTDIAEEYKGNNSSEETSLYADEGELAYLEDDEIEKVKNICINGYYLKSKTPSIVRRGDKIYEYSYSIRKDNT